MAKNLIPKSKAKTAYELLDEVIDLIAEEPKRYNQSVWRVMTSRGDWLPEEKTPKCGTVCCVAGWVDTLKSKAPTEDVGEFSPTRGIGGAARKILGLTAGQARSLFHPDAAGDTSDVESGTDEHARLGILHIRKFQKRYAAQLKAKRV